MRSGGREFDPARGRKGTDRWRADDEKQRSKPVKLKLIATLFAVLATVGHAQDTVDLSLNDARNLATRSLMAGDAGLAVQIAEAILTQNPDDRAALIVIAAGAPQIGDPARARKAGARAWGLSTTDTEKYEAARLTALAAANDERLTLATFWLRRALTVAPSDAERARTIRDARAVRQRNPLSFQVSGSLVPSSNVNGGADEQSSTQVGDFTQTLSDDALALEGWRGSLNLGLQYRFQESRKSRTTAGLAYQIGRVRITESTDVPDEALDTAYYEASLRHDRALENGTLSVRATRGLFEYRDLDLRAQTTAYQDYDLWKLNVDRNIPLNDRVQLTLSAGRDWLTYLNDGIGKVERTKLTTGLSYRWESGNRLSASLGWVDSVGDNDNYTSESRSLNLGFSFAQPVELSWAAFFDLGAFEDFERSINFLRPLGPVNLSLGAGIRWSDYPDYRILLPIEGGRQDETYSFNMNMGFPKFEYAGFVPSLRFDTSETSSNVDRFNRTTSSVGLTFQSSF